MSIIRFVAENAIIILTGITVIILAFYTGETFRLRKESQKQTLNLFTPYLALKISDSKLYIVNLGKGIAKDIIFDPKMKIDKQVVLNITAIGSGKEKPLLVLDKDGNGAWRINYYEFPKNLDLVYWDTLGNKYVAKFLKLSQYQSGFAEVYQKRIFTAKS